MASPLGYVLICLLPVSVRGPKVKNLMTDAGFVDIGEKLVQVGLFVRFGDISVLKVCTDTDRTLGKRFEEQRDRHFPERSYFRLHS